MEKMSNKEYRAKLRKDPHSVLNYISKDIDIVVKTNTKETIYMALSKTDGDMPNLSEVSAAGTVGTVTTIATLGTIGTASGFSVSTIGTAGTMGSASTANVDIDF